MSEQSAGHFNFLKTKLIFKEKEKFTTPFTTISV